MKTTPKNEGQMNYPVTFISPAVLSHYKTSETGKQRKGGHNNAKAGFLWERHMPGQVRKPATYQQKEKEIL